MPEARVEIVEGEVCFVSPAEPPHASRHSKIAALLEAHVAEGYDATVDMLTRTSQASDFAPDASVYSTAPDDLTGERSLEELAFEVVSTETLNHAGRKAAELTRRGVRRVFAIDVERRRALEWSSTTSGWRILASTGVISDPVLAVPLPVGALVDAAKADDAMAAALLAKKNPVLVAALDESREAGELKGRAEGKIEGELSGKLDAVLLVLRGRGLTVTSAEEGAIRKAFGAAVADEWLRRAGTVHRAAELLRRVPPRAPRKRR